VPTPDALAFPNRHGRHLQPGTLYEPYYKARMAAGRPDLRWHDLRHTGAVLAATTGATLAELMAPCASHVTMPSLQCKHARHVDDVAGQRI